MLATILAATLTASPTIAPGYLANYGPQPIDLAQHSTGNPTGIASLDTSGTKGIVKPAGGTKVTYQPGPAFATEPKGATQSDGFKFCLAGAGGASSCATVHILVFGTAVAAPPPVVVPPPVITPPPAGYACARQWYVSPTGKTSGTGAASSPWNSLTAADWSGQLQGGDCVNVLAGAYPLTGTAYLSSHGTAAAPIVWRSMTPLGAHVLMSSKVTSALVQTSGAAGVGGSFTTWDGFEFDGAGKTGNVCFAAFQTHHVIVTNSKLHDCGDGGFAGINSDWLTVTNNEVYSTAQTGSNQGSGISIWDPVVYPGDATAKYRMQIVGNLVHGNTETSAIAGQHTDGNGIIIDDFQNTQSGGARPAYPYRTLVQSNSSYGNGGRGVHLFLSDLVDVISNVAYGNCLDPALQPTCGELSSQNSNDATWTNNKAMSSSAASDPAVFDDIWQGAPVRTYTGNATLSATTGQRSYSFVNYVSAAQQAKDAAAFLANNPVGTKLP